MNRCRIKMVDIIKENWNDFKKCRCKKIPKDIKDDIYQKNRKFDSILNRRQAEVEFSNYK